MTRTAQPRVLLELNAAALDLWGLGGLGPARREHREPSRISNLRKRRDRICATQRAIASGSAVGARQIQAMEHLAEIEAAIGEWERTNAHTWANRFAALVASRQKGATGPTGSGLSLLVRDLHALLVDFDADHLTEVCMSVVRQVLGADDADR